MSSYRIRKAEVSDAAALCQLMGFPSCYRNTLQLPFPARQLWQQRLQKEDSLQQRLVLETEDGLVIAQGALWREGTPGLAHGARLGMAVHQDWQGRGVGSALLRALLEVADHWPGLHRVELTVFTDNIPALALYRKYGFEEEARLRAYALRDGHYEDVLKMARLRSAARLGS